MSFQEKAADVIRASGGRMTNQRQLLLDLLASTPDDIDADRLHQLASQQDPGLSLPTVYRTLNALEAAHIISARYLSSGHDRKVYRVAAEGEIFHFTCRNCGQVIAFRSDVIDQFRRELDIKIGAEVATLCICAGGLCPDCREEKSG